MSDPSSFGQWAVKLNKFDVLLSLSINLLAAGVAFGLGLTMRSLPRNLWEWRLRRFWGAAMADGKILICHGTMRVERLPGVPSPFVKTYRDGTWVRVQGPSEDVMGDSEIRSSTHVVRGLSQYKKAVSVAPDSAAFDRLDNTLVALGSSNSNEVTRLVLAQAANKFFDFGQDNHRAFIVNKRNFEKFLISDARLLGTMA